MVAIELLLPCCLGDIQWLWSKKCQFLSKIKVNNVHLEVGGGQKRAKLCPRSHWMSPCCSHNLCFRQNNWVDPTKVFSAMELSKVYLLWNAQPKIQILTNSNIQYPLCHTIHWTHTIHPFGDNSILTLGHGHRAFSNSIFHRILYVKWGQPLYEVEFEFHTTLWRNFVIF